MTPRSWFVRHNTRVIDAAVSEMAEVQGSTLDFVSLRWQKPDLARLVLIVVPDPFPNLWEESRDPYVED
jgi:hypothetical protein